MNLRPSLHALRIAVWLHTRQWANIGRLLKGSPLSLLATLIAFLIAAAGVAVYQSLELEEMPTSPDAPILWIWIEVYLLITLSTVYLLLRSLFSWHRLSKSFHMSDVDFLFATPAFDVRLMRVLMSMREMLLRPEALILSILPIALIWRDLDNLRTMGNYYLTGGYLALSYVALRLCEYTAYQYVSLWTATVARRTPRIGWYLAPIVVAWGAASLVILVGTVLHANSIQSVADFAEYLSTVLTDAESGAESPLGSAQAAETILQSPTMRIVALPSAAAADALIAPARGLNPWIGAAGLLWVAVIALCSRQAQRNAGWLREAIATGVQYNAAQNRSPQTASHQAFPPDLNPQLTALPTPLQRWNPRGVYALLWRDLLIAWRVHPIGKLSKFALGGLFFAITVGTALIVPRENLAIVLGVAGLLILLGFAPSRHIAQHLVYRDTQTDLAFGGRVIIRYFVLLRGFAPSLLSVFAYLLALALMPAQWFVWTSALAFTNLSILTLAALQVLESLLAADALLEIQQRMIHIGFIVLRLLGALTAGSLQIDALLLGGTHGALLLWGLSALTLATLYGIIGWAVRLWVDL